VATKKPNVIFIITDQQRASTLRCYGQNEKVHTPSIDRLAREGIRFNSCYASQPVCSPSRSSIVTGLYPNATSVVDNCNPYTRFFLPDDRFSWLRRMHDDGYTVCNIGKWHLGVSRRPIPEYFDIWHGFETGWGHWIINEPEYPRPGEIQSGGEQPHVIPEGLKGRYRIDEDTDFAIELIRENREHPFACVVSYYPPHAPRTAPAEDVGFYEERISPHEQAVYHAMVHRIDRNVGRIMEAVDSCGLREDTIVVFTSDHGENYPLRWNQHRKRLCYDQSANVPFIISWPGTLGMGRTVDQVLSNVDFGPTILDLCGLDWPEELHGDSARALLQGDVRGPHEDIMIENNPYRMWDGDQKDMRERCLVTNEWKLILNNMRPPELFRRRTEEIPENNLYPDEAETAGSLTERLLEWGRKTGDDLTGRIVSQWL
jgi:arylsulfatase A-like enzyme